MLTIRHRAAIGALALVMTALPIVLLSTAAQAGEPAATATVPADVAAFNRGVARAADEVCAYPRGGDHFARCAEAVREEAMDQLSPSQYEAVAAYDREAAAGRRS